MNLERIPLRPDTGALREAAMVSLARACLDVARSVHDRSGKSQWDDRVAGLLTRAASAPTSLANAQALRTVALSFVASLVPVSAAAAVIARSLQLTFDNAAQISVPALTLPTAAWTGEGAPIPVVQGVSAAGALVDPYKLAIIVALTGEMIRNSNAEAFVRQVLLENVGPTLDTALFSANAAVAGVSPAGILNGIAALAASAATSPADAMVADIQSIATALAPAAGASQPVLIAAPAQAAALTLRAPRDLWPVLASAAVPDKTIIGVVPAGIATVIEPPRIEASSATAHTDDVPKEIVDIGGVLAAPVRSFFQIDAVALRLVLPASFARRSANAVAWVTATKW
jgi:Phage capsid family